ncbi:hypothetical protein KR009_011740 [Drosophila setifemur]|nr:hypothetical protein KR009_011740 [Drosophila setifemur]
MAGNKNDCEFNDDELVPPEWLDSGFIKEVLQSHEQTPGVNVIDVSFSPATAKGDHYASIMFRAKVKYTTPKGEFTKSLIIKTMPEADGHKKDMLGGSPIHITELGMYMKVLPEFERILRQAGDQTKLFAECFYHSMEPHQVLIFEDLVESGYFIPRDRDVTLEETKCAYFKLAKWHAASLKVQNEQPDFLKEYTNGLLEMPHFLHEAFITSGIANFVELLGKEPELNKYKPYFENIKDDFLDRLMAEWNEWRNNPKVDQYRTLCHGDLHLRNMMFKYEKESLKDCMLLDFQLSNLFPLSTDLIYSTYMLLEPAFRWEHWEEIINYYFSVFEDTLKKIDYKGEMPTQADLWDRLHQHKFFELFLISTFLPLSWALRDKSADMGDLLQNEESIRNSFNSQGYIKDVKILLARLDKFGYFKDV